MGIPREDARFVLPYCIHSNFLCTMNLRELCHFISVSLSRQLPRCEEIRALATSLRDQLVSIAPFLEDTGIFEAPEFADKDVYNEVAASYDLATAPSECRADVEIAFHTPSPDQAVASAVLAQLQREGSARAAEVSVDRLVGLTADRRWIRNLEHGIHLFSEGDLARSTDAPHPAQDAESVRARSRKNGFDGQIRDARAFAPGAAQSLYSRQCLQLAMFSADSRCGISRRDLLRASAAMLWMSPRA